VSEKDGREAVVDEREESKRQTKERTAPKKKNDEKKMERASSRERIN